MVNPIAMTTISYFMNSKITIDVPENEQFQVECVERDIDRGVFCLDGFEWCRGTRRKLKRLFANEPTNRLLWKQLSNGLNGNAHDVLERFESCLPRNEDEAVDPRYFGVHWGIGTALMSDDIRDASASASHFRHAIITYGERARPNHYRQTTRLLVEHLHGGEYEAAAMLQRMLNRHDVPSNETRDAIMELFSELEVSALPGDRQYSKNRKGFRKF